MGEACSLEYQSQWAATPAANAAAWYAIQTGYRYEPQASADLAMKGIETYLPLISETRRSSDRENTRMVPAFGGYLFARFEPTLKNRVRVLETRGILRLLGGNNSPMPVSDNEVGAVRQALQSGVSCERCDSFSPGDLVRVRRGPLTGILGRLIRVKSGLRVVIAISTMAQGISAEVGVNDVTLVEGHS
jgi:transcriptional antiterminator RfaH